VHTEQYYVHTDPAVEVLAVTDFVEDGTTLPVTWTRNWGDGRFCHHHRPQAGRLDVPEVTGRSSRGCQWATR